MTRQLSRIRSLITEIDDIQRKGQAAAKPWVKSVESEETFEVPQDLVKQSFLATKNSEVSQPKVETKAEKGEKIAPATPGKVMVQMTGNVVIQLQLEETSEIVEVQRLDQVIEIRFNDGKAIHLPIKSVA